MTPSITVQQYNESMQDDVLRLLEEFDNPTITKDHWKNILTYNWEQPEDYRGLVLMANDQVVGFLGLLFSNRPQAEGVHKICSLAGWIVRQPYRNACLRLVYPLLQMKEYTIANLTSFAEGVPLMKKLGFQELDRREYVIPTLLINPISIWSHNNITVLSEEHDLTVNLNDHDRKIMQDHKPFDCLYILVRKNNDRYCLAVLKEAKKRNLGFARLHYISDPPLFCQALDRVKAHLLIRRQILAILADERLLRGKPLCAAFRRTLPVPRLYKPSSESPPHPDQVDNLYSELILLK